MGDVDEIERVKREFRKEYQSAASGRGGAKSQFELFLIDLCFQWYLKGHASGLREAQRELESTLKAGQ